MSLRRIWRLNEWRYFMLSLKLLKNKNPFIEEKLTIFYCEFLIDLNKNSSGHDLPDGIAITTL
ncbi:hypothetical protein BH10BAC4_BH10BAC4_06240 [soil metagenome]